MIYKTAELDGALLDLAVAKIEGLDVTSPHMGLSQSGQFVRVTDPNGAPDRRIFDFAPSRLWDQAGPIIERECISLLSNMRASKNNPIFWVAIGNGDDRFSTGPTPLVAAMRMFVSSKLGDEVELP